MMWKNYAHMHTPLITPRNGSLSSHKHKMFHFQWTCSHVSIHKILLFCFAKHNSQCKINKKRLQYEMDFPFAWWDMAYARHIRSVVTTFLPLQRRRVHTFFVLFRNATPFRPTLLNYVCIYSITRKSATNTTACGRYAITIFVQWQLEFWPQIFTCDVLHSNGICIHQCV